MIKQTIPFCLASGSPRRSELLQFYGFQFTKCNPDIDENALNGELPKDYVQRLAKEKAKDAQKRDPHILILAGDTIVVQDGQILGKPNDLDDARHMLTLLSGKKHNVYSAYCLASEEKEIVNIVKTKVEFYPIHHKWIEAYLATKESLDKAGAYAIQGLGSLCVKSIEGSFDAVVGFPMAQIIQDFISEGWAVWE